MTNPRQIFFPPQTHNDAGIGIQARMRERGCQEGGGGLFEIFGDLGRSLAFPEAFWDEVENACISREFCMRRLASVVWNYRLKYQSRRFSLRRLLLA